MWYRAAQEVRVREDLTAELVFEDESEAEPLEKSPELPKPKLQDVPEDSTPASPTPAEKRSPKDAKRSQARRTAANELYRHEVLALISCFACPLLAAYLLHGIRSQLTRPSEGLVSNYNLTIFMLASEIRPLSHLLTLVQSRTLHLQRVVHSNLHKHEPAAPAYLSELTQRLDQLESRVATGDFVASQNGGSDAGGGRAKQEAAMVRDVRNAIQPELDALNRAVRRYEKKATLLAFQTESRLGALDTRLDDAIALAAAAAKNSNAQRNVAGRLLSWAGAAILLPVRTLSSLVYLPFKAFSGLLSGYKKGGANRTQWGLPHGKSPAQGRTSADRPSTRLSKR